MDGVLSGPAFSTGTLASHTNTPVIPSAFKSGAEGKFMSAESAPIKIADAEPAQTMTNAATSAATTRLLRCVMFTEHSISNTRANADFQWFFGAKLTEFHF